MEKLLGSTVGRFACLLLLASCILGDDVCAQGLPDFGVMYNNDGDISYPSPDPAVATQFLESKFGAFANTPVQTVMYSIGSGSDVLHYPTQVANNFGWRITSVDNDPGWVDRVNNGKIYAQIDFDPIRVVGEKVKAMGKYFVPSYRMNDSHFVVDPLDYPLTGEFWINNQDKTIGSSPVAGYDYSNLLDYSHQEVRDYRMAVINESIDRYSDIMDGYELDFNRFQILFSPGTAQTNAPLITHMVAQVRQRLDQVETQTGRAQHLFVRVPPALDNNGWSGLEVESWMQTGLVDVVIPSVLQTLSHDVPVGEFLPTAQANGVQVVPSIYPRTNFGWDFEPNPDATAYTGPSNARVAEPALTRGAIGGYRHLGADGFQMYNYGLREPPSYQEVWDAAAEAMASEHPTLGKDRIYAVTPGYFNDHEDTYEYAKQLPLSVLSQASHQFLLVVGDAINTVVAENPRSVELRLGLTNTTSTTPITIKVNGQQIHSGSMADGYFSLDAPVTQDGPQAYFQIPVEDLSILNQGTNTIEVFNSAVPNAVRVTDIQLGIFAALGIINPGDSSTFPFRYEGDMPTLAGTTASGFGTTNYSGNTSGYQLSSDGDVLSVTENGGPGSVVFLQSPDWTSSATDANGWTWEVRFKLESGQFTMRIGDDTDAHDILNIFDDGRVVSRIDGLLTTLSSTTDEMHTYRIAQAPGSDEYNVWVDGELIGLYDAADSGIGVGGPHWWSDGGSTTGDYQLDYIRFSDGGFSPYTLPDPSADFNEDGIVDGMDFLILQQGLGSSGFPSTLFARGDADGNGEIDEKDLQIFQSQYGTSSSEAATARVPEPTRLVLLFLGMLGTATSRRSRKLVSSPRAVLFSKLRSCSMLLLTLSLVGCGRSDGIDRVLVAGNVTFTGEPVEAGQIRFRPAKGTRAPITITAIKSGQFDTAQMGGIPVGTHLVQITSYDPQEYEAKRNRGPGVAPPTQLLPPKYNNKTELTLELNSGSGQITQDYNLVQ
ncbi:dockerin type I domain-containing protein [Adhaeretor mobilis]|uniref:Glycosyl hydrolase-like 10 domain-containing protein n=1 Tax=Adhaeretor mobilis TaxID=1930276 RepID=A0A517MWQ0_9BACT|nr:dockerin type I domain-containing protein [Adhaeretor mobilis]QDS99301.1 hypothetical protein HG15A2_26230 [Adhaeretor mobilis]